MLARAELTCQMDLLHIQRIGSCAIKVVVGVSNIRHSLTAALRREGGNIGYGIRPSARRRGFGATILRKSLDRAGALGLSRVLVTCAKSNVGSVKAILRNGGILESEEYLADRGELVQRYWIESGSNAGT